MNKGVRIIGGAKRGMKLHTPAGTTTRPTMDRARETIINMVVNNATFRPHVIQAYVADVCAGCGAVGLEMLSRGAMGCVFYENDRRALQALQANVAHFAPDVYTIKNNALIPHKNDCMRMYTSNTDTSNTDTSGEKQAFDCVFIDPPYTDPSLSQRAIDIFITQGLIDQTTLIIVQADTAHPSATVPHFAIKKHRKIAGGYVYFYVGV